MNLRSKRGLPLRRDIPELPLHCTQLRCATEMCLTDTRQHIFTQGMRSTFPLPTPPWPHHDNSVLAADGVHILLLQVRV